MHCAPARDLSRRLNEYCFCASVDHGRLREALLREVADEQLLAALLDARPHLFASTPVFLAPRAMEDMLATVQAIEAVAALPAFGRRCSPGRRRSPAVNPVPSGCSWATTFT